MLLGFSALAIDLGYARMVHTELQHATDAVTRSAVLALDGTEEGLTAAQQVAVEVGTLNTAGNVGVVLDEGTVLGSLEFGVWDPDSSTFEASDDPAEMNAVSMEASLPGVGGWLLGDIGQVSTVSSASIASRETGGASEVNCRLPLSLPVCLVEDVYGIGGIQDVDLVFNPAGIDNIGWSRASGWPNANALRNQVEDCTSDGALEVGSTIYLNNGVMNSVLSTLVDELEASDTQWNESIWGPIPEQYSQSAVSSSLYGNTLEGAIALFEDDAYCSSGGGSWNHTAEVVGFVYGAIYDVRTRGSAANKNVRVRIDTTNDNVIGTEGGGPDYGVLANSEPILVR